MEAKKIDEAARLHCILDLDRRSAAYELGFEAGARWTLDETFKESGIKEASKDFDFTRYSLVKIDEKHRLPQTQRHVLVYDTTGRTAVCSYSLASGWHTFYKIDPYFDEDSMRYWIDFPKLEK